MDTRESDLHQSEIQSLRKRVNNLETLITAVAP